MRKLFLSLIGVIFMILTIAVVLNGCSNDSGSGGGENSCGDGLLCYRVSLCCPPGSPYFCDGQCYASPVSGCNQADTCKPE